MRRHRIVALCLAVGALIAAAITPGVIGSGAKVPVASPEPPGYVIDYQAVDNSDPTHPSVITYSHRPVREIKPGEPGYVPEPPPGDPRHEETGR